MYTCCPHCKTCFRITQPQLAVAQGKVRCGTCAQIFNAREHLYETLPERKPATGRPPPAPSRSAPASAASSAPTPPSAPESPPPARHDETPQSGAGTHQGPDLDLFSYARTPDEPESPADELDDVFLEAEAEEEDTAVIDMGDWDELDLEETEPATTTPAGVPEEFHAPVHEPVITASDEEDEAGDLFDEEDEAEDTAVIDLSGAPDPFAPHAGVPLHAAEDEEDEEDFLFDEEEDEDVTAVIEIADSREFLADIPGMDETPLADEDTKAPLADHPPATPAVENEAESLFAPDAHFLDRQPAGANAPAAKSGSSGSGAEPAAKRPEHEDSATGNDAADEKSDDSLVITADPGHYTYVDPEELRKEEKNIDEIIAEMNAQLAEAIDTPDETDAAHEARRASATPRPGGDDFESSFLANLDDVLNKPLPETPATSARSAAAEKPPVRPADVLDIINPADNINQGMVPDETIPLPLREELVTEAPRGNVLKFGLQILLVLILLAGLGLQLAVFRSTEIANALPGLRPLLELVCQRVECRYNGPVDVDRIQLVSRDIRDHPTRPDALLIKATLVNKAPFAQPFPDMEITLSDLAGAVVARRRFHPREYLGSYWQPFLLMRPNQPVQVTLEVLNPGQDAVNFEFAFKPAQG